MSADNEDPIYVVTTSFDQNDPNSKPFPIGYARGDTYHIRTYFAPKAKSGLDIKPIDIVDVTADMAKETEDLERQLRDAREKLNKR